ncbi:MAG: type IV pilus twitching motility protein PilT [Dethiobacter sp.]|jgi:twitching motility protein PilT|nr:MAG: type IV pilus twitching motility protein PilT [Dethiobacter sp.]
MDIDDLLRQAVDRKASDLHLTVGAPPILRLNGALTPVNTLPLKLEDTRALAEQMLNKEEYNSFQEKGEVDLSYSITGVGRFRVNIYRQRGTVSIAARVLNTEIPTISSLGLPEILCELVKSPKGLILVTGPTGSGKSTTLAAMIDYINENSALHILTLEDPIEYQHKHKKSIVNQREMGADSKSFPNALRAALRQDPDVILVGEMRDLETTAIAMTAAETGHLVMATLHTIDAPQTIDRIIDVFPPSQQQQIRVQLSNTLAGIISQRLLPRKDGKGRVAALEILVSTPAVRNLIREGKIHQIYSVLQTGSKFGMQTMESHLQHLYDKGLVRDVDSLNRR